MRLERHPECDIDLIDAHDGSTILVFRAYPHSTTIANLTAADCHVIAAALTEQANRQEAAQKEIA